MRSLIICFAFLLAACSPTEEPVLVTFDDLTSRPEEFSDREVVVDGVLAMGLEAMVFQHPNDPGRDSDIWWDYGAFPEEEASARGFDLLKDAFAKAPNKGEAKIERMVRVRIEGSFSHANRKGGGFGHLGGFASRLVIERVLEAEPLKKKAEPSATDNPDDAQRLREDD
jgi:hypothetical protein